MNCWKTVNMNKEYGQERLYFMSMLIAVLSFLILYVPFSIYHHHTFSDDRAFLPFAAALILLPTIHSCLHVLPLLLLRKPIKIISKMKIKFFPMFYFCTKTHVSKPVSLFTALAPTLLFTVPGLLASFMFKEVYGYVLILTAANIGISLKDFIYAAHLVQAPKRCCVSSRTSSLDILIEQD